VVPWEVTFLIALTLFLHIAGYSYYWYVDFYPYYDKFTRLIASMTVALLGFLAVLIIMRVSDDLQFKRWHIFFFIVIFTLALGVIWEIWEFTLDSLAEASPIQPLQLSNTDTMLDLIADLGGGIIIAVLGTFYLKRKCECDWADIVLEPEFEEIAVRFKR
jgi:magnesium-transporting ATPase (P-type)